MLLVLVHLSMRRERVLCVYLQVVFELALDDEVETASSVVQHFAPLTSTVSIQWIHFLLAMNRRLMAKQTLRDLLTSLAMDKRMSFRTDEYNRAAETMVLQLLLPDEGIDAARQFVMENTELDDSTKAVRTWK